MSRLFFSCRLYRSLTAFITLTSYVWVMVAPTVAYAQDAATAEPAQMVPLAEYERIGGGSLSTAGDRARSATGDVGQDDAPRASTGAGFEDVESEGEDGQSGDGSGPAREGENDGAPTDGSEEVGEGDEPSTDALALPSGDDKSGVTSQAISIPKGAGSIQGMGA